MNMKLRKLLDEIQKTEDKIAEWQGHLKDLNERKKQMEDAEIIKSIRSMKLNSREMLELLSGIQDGSATILTDEMDADEESNTQIPSDSKKTEQGKGQTQSIDVSESEDLIDEDE